MVAKVRGSGERFWSTRGSGLAHTASHSAVWIDFALDVAGESATATTTAIRSLRIVAPPQRLAIAHRAARPRSRHGLGPATFSAARPSPRRGDRATLAIEEIECEREDVGHGHLLAREAGLRADRHRAFLRSIGKPPVRSPDDGRIERDHVHEVAEAERLAGERPGGAELHQRASGIEEELRGVVAGLAMNVDGAREVGSPRVIEPVVIGEPGIALRARDEISRPLVVETELRLSRIVEHSFHAIHRAEALGHSLPIL